MADGHWPSLFMPHEGLVGREEFHNTEGRTVTYLGLL